MFMKVYIESYGCTFNKADGQIMAGVLNENNIELVDNIDDAYNFVFSNNNKRR